jgi:hypothetical protein
MDSSWILAQLLNDCLMLFHNLLQPCQTLFFDDSMAELHGFTHEKT